MKRFLRNPTKIAAYITNKMLQLVKDNIPTRKIWTKKFAHTQANLATWLNEQPNKHDIKNLKYSMSGNHTGVLGIPGSGEGYKQEQRRLDVLH